MARQRNPNREKAFEIYQENKGKIDLVEIARQLDISAGTVRGWKSKDKWEQKLNGTLQKNTERSKRKRGGQPKNINAKKHGLFERYLPEETLDIVRSIKDNNPLDLLWDQIILAYAAIIRSQKIMYVDNLLDHTKITDGEFDNGNTYQIETAQIKHGNYLNSLSRVQSQLNNMIKQYEKMINENPLATEEQKARIENIKARTAHIKGSDNDFEDIEDIRSMIYGDKE
ncbi:phage terminase small subunit-related protein [Helcococcus kunzii]|uniref:phage terminase small subunit-related protein n=1 Tax=Helcococcus kunzii TaxID=40091 RepID=UPI001BB09606|nr:phage terminase small subunit-related protein [Helcococcus kunzii]QUY65097.1 terminase [Helcococcus kunzii]